MTIPVEDFVRFAHRTLGFMAEAVARLDDGLVNECPAGLPGANTPFAIVTHTIGAFGWWTAHMVCGHPSDRDRAGEFAATGTVAEAVAACERAAADLTALAPELAAAATVAGEPRTTRPLDGPWTVGACLMHAYEELAQHLGQLEITVDALLAAEPDRDAVGTVAAPRVADRSPGAATTSTPTRRSPVVGVVGAGQLGRMLHQAAIGPGVSLRFLAASADDPVLAVSPDHRAGSALDPAALAAFASEVDVVTFEHEVVDLDALDALAAAGHVIRPSPAALRTAADKLVMRTSVEAAGLPVPAWRRADTPEEAAAAVTEWGGGVLKLARGGYDGRGVFVVADADEARTVATELLEGGVPLLVEPKLDLDAEIAVIVARRPGGEAVVYDPVLTVQIDGQCRQVVAPAGIDDALVEQARGIGADTAAALDVVGLLAVELFVVGGELVVNELAMRPHNTGHHSIEACITSQFENHLRAVADLPLGDPSLRGPAAMVNVIGAADGTDPRARLADGLAVDPAAHVHLYGKAARPERKVGHVTVCDADPADAARRGWAVVAALGAAVPVEIGGRLLGA